jgi:acetamidase/formamidase
MMLRDRSRSCRARSEARGGLHLSSVCVDLRISEIVDAPSWIASALLPESVFG